MDTEERTRKRASYREAIRQAIFILLAALALDCAISTLLIFVDRSGRIVEVASNMLEGIIAAAAAGLVIHELRMTERQEKRENDIREATFILNYNQAFLQDPNMTLVEHLLEKQMSYGYKDAIIDQENRQHFINYLVYLEGLAPIILSGIMRFDHIDDLMAFRFFLAVNNRELQLDQLNEFPQFYKGCFKLYRKWTDYYKENNREIPFSETPLDALDCYEQYSHYK